MGKVWVLDTETKGTGAEMVPLEKALAKAAPAPRRARARPKRSRPPSKSAEPRRPRKFKLVDAMTRQVLAEGVGARGAVDLLREIRSVVDVSIYVWERKARRWRPLTHGEKSVLWARR